MPIFEYRCAECGERFEHLERHSSPAARCPACRGDQLEKLVSAAAVRSEGTQQRNLNGAKQRTAKQRYDRAYEDHKIAHDHDHD